jgi:hypothetical protein
VFAGSCSPDMVGDPTDGGIRARTAKGGIAISSTFLKNCDLHAVGQAALISVTDLFSESDGGGALLHVESELGVINVRVCVLLVCACTSVVIVFCCPRFAVRAVGLCNRGHHGCEEL